MTGVTRMGSVYPATRLNVDELHLLRGLLAFPTDDSYALVKQLARSWSWLGSVRDELESTSIDDWREEYRRLFMHGHAPALCPPYESAYAHGDVQWDIAMLYSRWGVSMCSMPPDYLGSELNLLAELLESEGDLGREPVAEIWEHLTAWVPRLADDLERHARISLYRGLAARLRELFA